MGLVRQRTPGRVDEAGRFIVWELHVVALGLVKEPMRAVAPPDDWLLAVIGPFQGGDQRAGTAEVIGCT